MIPEPAQNNNPEIFEKLAKNEKFYKLWQGAKAEAEKSEDKLSWESHN